MYPDCAHGFVKGPLRGARAICSLRGANVLSYIAVDVVIAIAIALDCQDKHMRISRFRFSSFPSLGVILPFVFVVVHLLLGCYAVLFWVEYRSAENKKKDNKRTRNKKESQGSSKPNFLLHTIFTLLKSLLKWYMWFSLDAFRHASLSYALFPMSM